MTEAACTRHGAEAMSGTDCGACGRLSALKDRLLDRVPKQEDAPGCFLCKWILLDLDAHDGKLKGWNLDMFGQPIFPKKAELIHLKLEGIPFVEAEL